MERKKVKEKENVERKKDNEGKGKEKVYREEIILTRQNILKLFPHPMEATSELTLWRYPRTG